MLKLKLLAAGALAALICAPVAALAQETAPTATPPAQVAPAAPAASAPAASAPAAAPGTVAGKPTAAQALAERSIGAADAPVVIREFASLSCPHCAHFHTETYPELKKAYIDTGVVRLIFSDYPLNRPALDAAILARCAPPERYFALLSVLFEQQAQWATKQTYRDELKKLGALAGVGPDVFETCIGDRALQEGLVEMRKQGNSQYQVQSTPTFIFNDGAEKIVGAGDYAQFVATIDKLAKEAGVTPKAQ